MAKVTTICNNSMSVTLKLSKTYFGLGSEIIYEQYFLVLFRIKGVSRLKPNQEEFLIEYVKGRKFQKRLQGLICSYFRHENRETQSRIIASINAMILKRIQRSRR